MHQSCILYMQIYESTIENDLMKTYREMGDWLKNLKNIFKFRIKKKKKKNFIKNIACMKRNASKLYDFPDMN